MSRPHIRCASRPSAALPFKRGLWGTFALPLPLSSPPHPTRVSVHLRLHLSPSRRLTLRLVSQRLPPPTPPDADVAAAAAVGVTQRLLLRQHLLHPLPLPLQRESRLLGRRQPLAAVGAGVEARAAVEVAR